MKTKAGIEKPLVEWTLREAKDMCHMYAKCPLEKCEMYLICGTDISRWDLSEKPKFTEQEVQDAKSIIRIWGLDDITIGRNKYGDTVIFISREIGGDGFIISNELFPSIKAGQEFCASEIIGDAHA